MERQGDEVHIETDEARGGSSPNIVRWVLGISLFAAIILLSVIWMTGAATQSEAEGAGTADGRARALGDYGTAGGVTASDGDDTDSIVGTEAGELDAVEPGETASGQPAAGNEANDAPPAPAAT